jgi:hypothetical protein
MLSQKIEPGMVRRHNFSETRLGIVMRDRFQIFEAILERRRRGAWRWKVYSAEGDVIVRGLDISRRAAGYNANRALFQMLLSAPYHSKRQSRSNSPSLLPLGRTRLTP